jgi:hypothetical protein
MSNTDNAHLLTYSKSERTKTYPLNQYGLVIILYRTDLYSTATIRLYNLPLCCDQKENTAKRFENTTLQSLKPFSFPATFCLLGHVSTMNFLIYNHKRIM